MNPFLDTFTDRRQFDNYFASKDLSVDQLLSDIEHAQDVLLEKTVHNGTIVDRGILGKLGVRAVAVCTGTTSEMVAPRLISDALQQIEGDAISGQTECKVVFADQVQRESLRRLREQILPVADNHNLPETLAWLRSERAASRRVVEEAQVLGERLDTVEASLAQSLTEGEIAHQIGVLREVVETVATPGPERQHMAALVREKADQLYYCIQQRGCDLAEDRYYKLRNAMTNIFTEPLLAPRAASGVCATDFHRLITHVRDRIATFITTADDIDETVREWPWSTLEEEGGSDAATSLSEAVSKLTASAAALKTFQDTTLPKLEHTRACRDLVEDTKRKLGANTMRAVLDVSEKLAKALEGSHGVTEGPDSSSGDDFMGTEITPDTYPTMMENLEKARLVAQAAILNEQLRVIADRYEQGEPPVDLLQAFNKDLSELRKAVDHYQDANSFDGDLIAQTRGHLGDVGIKEMATIASQLPTDNRA